MVTKVSMIYRTDINKRDHRQTMDGSKKKTQQNFKDILAKELLVSPEKPVSGK